MSILGGSGVVISRAIRPLIWVISIVTLLITTHEPPSRFRVGLGHSRFGVEVWSLSFRLCGSSCEVLGFRVSLV